MNFDDELKRRMELARQQGWGEDEIARSSLIERGIHSQQQRAQQQQPQQTGAGRAGGLKGLALDLLPFGRVIEKTVNPNAGDISAGEIGMEALLSLVPFGLGRLAKGGRALKTAVTGRKPTIRPTTTKGASGKLLRTSTIAPTSSLKTASEQEALVDLTRRTPALRGSGRKKFQNVEGEIDRLSDEVDQLFSGVDNSTSSRDFGSNIDQVRREIVDPLERRRFNIEYDRLVRKTFNGKLPSQMSPTEVNMLRRAVNSQMTSIYRKMDVGTSLTDKDNAFLRLKETLDNQLATMAPKDIRAQVRALNLDQNTLIKGIPEFKRLAEQRTKPFGVDVPFISESIPQFIQAGSDYAGRVATNQVGRAVAAQGASRAGADVLGFRNSFKPDTTDQSALPTEPNLAFPNAQSTEEQLLNDALASGITDFGQLDQILSGGGMATQDNLGTATPAEAGGLRASSYELFDAAIAAQMAGDSKTADQYLQMATAISKYETDSAKAAKEAAGGGGPNITKVTAQQYGLAQSGAEALNNLRSLLQNDPSVVNRSATPGRGLPVVGGYLSNAVGTGDFDAVGYNIADSILRLRTGATANADEVRKLQSQIIPRAGDSQQTIDTKLRQIELIFSNVLDLAGRQPTGNDLPDELMQLFGGEQAAYGY